MSSQQHKKMRQRYVSIGSGELVSVVVFAVVAWRVTPRFADPTDVRALWSALVPLLLILIQGGAYWLLARRWIGTGHMPRGLAAVYRVFRVVDVAILAGGLVGVLVWFPDSLAMSALVVGIWLFGVLEYVNYFVVRLSYPLRTWLSQVARGRSPRLVQDLRRSRQQPPPADYHHRGSTD
ncbi:MULTISPECIES: hypothetical protein [unclassified Micromonospora]|uniref:hypothetical protein n=1 Tax=unclassified Micromonospora TaxID=2617518 RepID=UPI001C3756AD|nr:hypothetical protein [Verrucosispora sp. NA02020]